jgi:hypothetical protein
MSSFFLDSNLFETEFPPRELRAGALVRVRTGDGEVVEGVLKAVDRRGLRVEERERLLFPTFRGAGTNALFIEEEEAPSKRARGIAWNQIDTVQVRVRASGAGLIVGLVLTLALGWCGEGLDHLTDGTPKADLVYFGIGIGVLIGVLIARFGREWRTVWNDKQRQSMM